MHHLPEVGARVPLSIAAIAKNKVAKPSVEQMPIERMFQSYFSNEYVQWQQALEKEELLPERYNPLPIHPLTLPFIRDKYKDYLNSSDLVLLDIHIPAYRKT